MADFLRLVGEWLQYIFPFRIVHVYERGVMFRLGRFWKIAEPGCHVIVPFFMSLVEVTIVPGMVNTGRLNVTLQDGTTCSFVATAWTQVLDPEKAINSVEQFGETELEVLSAVCADRVARVSPNRLEPENRAALLRDLTGWVNAETEPFGIKVDKVRFSQFVLKARTFILLGDHS